VLALQGTAMATTNLMIQFSTEQYVSSLVTEVTPIDDEAFLILDPKKTTVVREIATEELGGILASNASGWVPVGITSRAFAELKLLPPRGEQETSFFAPSHVPSPPISNVLLAILRVSEQGVSVGSGGHLSVGRLIGAHAYIDQID
jgi:hypothetical protein